MATLVLSTVGTALGGPIGGAIGALIGQSIDQQLLGPSSRGPRLGDLSVQSSSYGTQVPRVYGTMRVAGSVVWSTDLVESTQTTGAKGQPGETFSYSVSFAVALSSRPVSSVGRIWADGKLLRGVDGDFKVSTTFRFYDGNEDQAIDPLIGSIEGIADTPAYRGFALAMFENLELAEFGNRIPFLTFELIADDEAPSIGIILEDASAGAIASDEAQTLIGYAAYGRSIRAAIEPLVSCLDVKLFDDGILLRSPVTGAPEPIADAELGNSANNQLAPRIQREQQPERSAPNALRLSYYDPDRDFQSGEARASAGEQSGKEEQQELPAVVAATDAKSFVQQMLARRWALRDRLILRLPPKRAGIEPGAMVDLALSPSRWIVDKCTIDGFVTVVELRPSSAQGAALAADAGRIVPNSDVVAGELSLALLDIPDVLQQSSGEPTLLLAASMPTPGWKRRRIEVSFAGRSSVSITAARKTVMGRTLAVLPAAQPYLIDTEGSVDVELIDHDQWLTSCSDEALAAGVNLALVGAELIQFGQATPIGPGWFRLEHLLRGRAGTEWAAAAHLADELFALIQQDALQVVSLPSWVVGSQVTVSEGYHQATLIAAAEGLKPLSPVSLTATILPGGDLQLSWTRRSRHGFAWIDEIDAPLGEAREVYRVTVGGVAGTIEREVSTTQCTIAAAELAVAGSGMASAEVRQLGDRAVSRPVQATILIP